MNDMILLPKSLTAENGAKALLIGEFHQQIERTCSDCFGDDPSCDICKGMGTYIEDVQISWTTIKEIYKKIVGTLGKEAITKHST